MWKSYSYTCCTVVNTSASSSTGSSSNSKMAIYDGTFQFEKHENMENYMKATGVPEAAIPKFINPATTITIESSGDNFVIKRKGIQESEVKFTLGQEYDEHLPNGEVVKTVMVKVGDNKLKSTSKSKLGTSEIVREFSDKQMVMSLKDLGSGVEGKRYYKKV